MLRTPHLTKTAFTSLLLCLLATTTAQAADPASANPERFALPSPNSPLQFTPPADDSETEQPTPLLTRPDNADDIRLQLIDIEITGISAVSPEEISRLRQPYLNTPITLSQFYELADNITRYYRDRGFVLARAVIPPQEIDQTRGRIIVYEGEIGQVSYEGPFADSPLINLTLERLRGQKIINIRQIESQLLLLGDLPGTSFRVLLRPSQSARGRVDLVVIGSKDDAVSASISFDNYGSAYLGPYMASASVELNNLLAPMQQTRMSLASSLQRQELSQLGLSHNMPLFGRSDLLFTAEASFSRGEPGYNLKANEIASRSFLLDMHLDWSLRRQRSESLLLTGGFNLRNSRTTVLSSPFTQDRLRSLYVAARYDWSDFLNGYNLARVQISQGLPGFADGSRNGDANLSRAEGRTDFTKLSLSLLRYQPLNSYFTLFGAMNAQLANGPLLSAEEFGYGGSFMGRAYDNSEMTGENGFSLLAEIRTPERPVKWMKGSWYPYAFMDYGAIWNRDSGQDKNLEGASAGLGLRLTSDKGLSADLTLAQPLMKSDSSTYPNNGGPRLLFSITAKF